MRAYLGTIQVVVFTKTKATLNFVPGMIVFPGYKVVGLEIKGTTTIGASTFAFNRPAP